MEGWGPCPLTAVTSNTGAITQLYPSWNRYVTDAATTGAPSSGFGGGGQTAYNRTAGDALPIAAGGLLLRPMGGRLGQVSVETDSTDGGIVQLFDLNGLDDGVDVSSLTAITNAQYTTLFNLGRAKLIFEQNVAAAPGAQIIWAWSQGFLRGLAARFIAASGTCVLNIIAEGGYQWINVAGTYSGG